jgi:hypothetical protein
MVDRAARGLGRRQFLIGTAIAGVAISTGPGSWAQQSFVAAMAPQTLSRSDIYLTIAHGTITID